jgi:hypothetical protein
MPSDFDQSFLAVMDDAEQADGEFDDAEALRPMGAQLRHATTVTLYHRATHEARLVPSTLAGPALKKRFPAQYPDAPHMAGQPVFSTKQEGEPPALGGYVCALNPNHPDYHQYSDWGFPTCPAEHLASPFHAQRHLEKKHATEWQTIKAAREAKQQQQDREQQALLYQALLSQAQPAVSTEKGK